MTSPHHVATAQPSLPDQGGSTPRWNTKALIALGIGIPFPLTCGISGIPALILGIKAHQEVARNPSAFKHGWTAIAGIIVGALGSLYLALAVFGIAIGALAPSPKKPSASSAVATAASAAAVTAEATAQPSTSGMTPPDRSVAVAPLAPPSSAPPALNPTELPVVAGGDAADAGNVADGDVEDPRARAEHEKAERKRLAQRRFLAVTPEAIATALGQRNDWQELWGTRYEGKYVRWTGRWERAGLLLVKFVASAGDWTAFSCKDFDPAHDPTKFENLQRWQRIIVEGKLYEAKKQLEKNKVEFVLTECIARTL